MITTTKNKISYVSDGTTTTYDFDFPAIEPTDIQVFVYDLNNSKTQLVYGTDYTVSLNSDNSGGTVTLTNPANKDYTVLIYREVPYTQETVYTENSPFPAKSHEKALDKLTMEVQQLNESNNRTLQYDPIDENSDVNLPPLQSNRWLGTDDNKKLIWTGIATQENKVITKTVDPTINDDASAGYKVGDVIINTSTKTVFQCVDATTGAAVWSKIWKGIGTKNRIINGDFSVWQRGTSFTFASTTGGYTADRFKTSNNASDGQITLSKNTMLNKNSAKINVDTAVTDLSGTRYFYGFLYLFEGQHLYDLAINGKDITISFWFNSNITGEYPISLINLTNTTINTQSYVTSFNYLTANTPQKITVTIPLNAVWNPALINDSNRGFKLTIAFLNQGDYVTPTTNSWIDGSYLTTSTAANWGATAGNFIEIAELQLEEGNVATDFEYVPYDIQLLRCMRYYEQYSYDNSLDCIQSSAYNTSTTYGTLKLFIEKRGVPSVLYSGTVSIVGNGGAVDSCSISVGQISKNFVRVSATDSSASLTSGYSYWLRFDTTTLIQVDAEL